MYQFCGSSSATCCLLPFKTHSVHHTDNYKTYRFSTRGPIAHSSGESADEVQTVAINSAFTCKDALFHVIKSRKIAALHSLQYHHHLIHLGGFEL